MSSRGTGSSGSSQPSGTQPSRLSAFRSLVSRCLSVIPRLDLTVRPEGSSRHMEYAFAHGSKRDPKIRAAKDKHTNLGNQLDPIEIDGPLHHVSSSSIDLPPSKRHTKDMPPRARSKRDELSNGSPYNVGASTSSGRTASSSSRFDNPLTAKGNKRGADPFFQGSAAGPSSLKSSGLSSQPSRQAVQKARQPLSDSRRTPGSFPQHGAASYSPPSRSSFARPLPSSSDIGPGDQSCSPEKRPDADSFNYDDDDDVQIVDPNRFHPRTRQLHKSLASEGFHTPNKPDRIPGSSRGLSGTYPGSRSPPPSHFSRKGGSAHASMTTLPQTRGGEASTHGSNRRGTFGSNKIRNDQSERRPGRDATISTSPTKRGGSHQLLSITGNSSEEEEVREEVEQIEEIENIENPDGVFKEDMDDHDGIWITGDIAPANPPNEPGLLTKGKAPLRLRSMKTKDASLHHAHPDKKYAPVTKVQPKNANIPTSFCPKLCGIRYARFVNDDIGVPAGTLRLEKQHFVVVGERKVDPEIVRIPITSLSNMSANIKGVDKMFMVDLRGGSGTTHVQGFLDLCKQPGLERQRNELSTLFALPIGSKEAEDFLSSLQDALMSQTGERVDIIDNAAAINLLDRFAPIQGRKGPERSRLAKKQSTEPKRGGSSRQRTRALEEIDDSDTSASRNRTSSKQNSKVKVSPGQKLLSFSKESAEPEGAAPRRSARVSRQPVVIMKEDSDDEAIVPSATVNSKVPTMSNKERSELLFSYPPEGRADLAVTKGDRLRVTSGDFLNDTLLEFGLRYVVDMLDPSMRSRVHLFNSFFYDKLTNKKGKFVDDDKPWLGYESVKKWTKHHNIFQKDFIIVPINEHYHWYFAVIYNPKGILKPAPIETESPSASGSEEVQETIESPKRDVFVKPQRTPHASDSDLDELDSTHEEDTLKGKATNLRSNKSNEVEVHEIDDATDIDVTAGDEIIGDETIASIDPLAMIDDTVEQENKAVNVNDATRGVKDLSIAPYEPERTDRRSQSNVVSPPTMDNNAGFIETPTMMMVRAQSGSEPARSVSPVKGVSNGKAQAVNKAELEIWNSEKCWILTCDSLGGVHKAVAAQLGRWLQYEARDKRVVDHDRLSAPCYKEAKAPLQHNFSDCGLYLIHFVQQLLQHPEEVIRFVQKPKARSPAEKNELEAEKARVWRAELTGDLRCELTGILDEQTAQYRSTREGKPVEEDLEGDDSQDFHEVTDPGNDPPSIEKEHSPNGTVEAPEVPPVSPQIEVLSNAISVDNDDNGVAFGVATSDVQEEVRSDGMDAISHDQLDIDPNLDEHVGADMEDDVLDEEMAEPYELKIRDNHALLHPSFEMPQDIGRADVAPTLDDRMMIPVGVLFPLSDADESSVEAVETVESEESIIVADTSINENFEKESSVLSDAADSTDSGTRASSVKPSGSRRPAASAQLQPMTNGRIVECDAMDIAADDDMSPLLSIRPDGGSASCAPADFISNRQTSASPDYPMSIGSSARILGLGRDFRRSDIRDDLQCRRSTSAAPKENEHPFEDSMSVVHVDSGMKGLDVGRGTHQGREDSLQSLSRRSSLSPPPPLVEQPEWANEADNLSPSDEQVDNHWEDEENGHRQLQADYMRMARTRTQAARVSQIFAPGNGENQNVTPSRSELSSMTHSKRKKPEKTSRLETPRTNTPSNGKKRKVDNSLTQSKLAFASSSDKSKKTARVSGVADTRTGGSSREEAISLSESSDDEATNTRGMIRKKGKERV